MARGPGREPCHRRHSEKSRWSAFTPQCTPSEWRPPARSSSRSGTRLCQQILLKEPRRSATLLPFSRTSPRGRRRKRTTRPWLQQGFVRRVRFSQKMPNALTALAIQPCLRPSPPRSPSLDKVGWISTLSGAPSRRIVTLLGSRSDFWSHPQGDQRDAWASLLCPRQAHNGCVLGAGEEVMPMHLLDIIVTAGCTWQVRKVSQLTFTTHIHHVRVVLRNVMMSNPSVLC